MALLVARGIAPSEYWDMTWGEICMVTRSLLDLQRRKDQLAAMIAWKEADLIGQHVALCLGSKRRIETLQKAFKELFESSSADDNEPWRELQARMMRSADKINTSRRK